MTYLTLDRIGPMEGGTLDGQYIEPGVVVDESVFKPESLPLLVESEALRPLTADEAATGLIVTAESNTGGFGVSEMNETAKEVEDGTHDSDGD